MAAMDDDNLMDVNFTDLDLNHEPTEPSSLDPVSGQVVVGGVMLDDDERETSRGRIAHRFRQLEAAVNAQSLHRHRFRQPRPNIDITPFPTDGVAAAAAAADGSTSVGEAAARCVEKGKGCKRDSSHLVAKALEMETGVRKAPEKEGGSFYDCNICLEIATEPVVTICGHLFCWACFYQVSSIDTTTKECPVCKGEVAENAVTPIYGNGGGDRVYVTENGLQVPPRPRAHRVEGVRQRRVRQGLSHVPVAEALRRIRISIGALGEHALDQEDRTGVRRLDAESAEGQMVGETSGSRQRINQVSRVLSESAASLSSLSSVLSSAERLVTNLQSDIHDNFPVIGPRAASVDAGDSPVIVSADQLLDIAPDPDASSSSWASGPLTRMRALRSSVARDIANSMLVASSSQQRRSANMSRILDLNNRDAREARRRRLN